MQRTNNRLRFLPAAFAAIFTISVMSACQDVSARPPAGTADPGFVRTAEGAQLLSRGVRFNFHLTLIDYMLQSGRFADEFYSLPGPGDGVGIYDEQVVHDARIMREESGTNIATLQSRIGRMVAVGPEQDTYTALQNVRTRALLARKALEAYDPTGPDSLRGEMMAYQAYSTVLLADLFCSGVPLSVLNLEDDYEYRPGTPTLELYEQAAALFDSVITLAHSAPTLRQFASISKGRALLALGRYTDAANAVSAVPEGFVFDLPVVMQWTDPLSTAQGGQTWTNTSLQVDWFLSDREGINGMAFRGPVDSFDRLMDPRIKPLVDTGRNCSGASCRTFAHRNFRRPRQPVRVKVATYLEARLIEAEALAQASDPQYLVILNRLRTNGTFTTSTRLTGTLPDTVRVTDTLYDAGTGGVARLAPLPDTASTLHSRIDVIMRERAFWLFFTGNRQGDLRRLIRHYNRTVDEIYPTGPYPGGTGFYEPYVDIPIDVNAERANTNFTGCFAQGA